MSDKEKLDLLIEGGKAAPGPTTAPKLSALKVDMGKLFSQINEKTAAYGGMQVPVKVLIDKKTKEFEITVGTPPVTSLIKKELGIEKAVGTVEKKVEVEVSEEGEEKPEEDKKEEESKEEENKDEKKEESKSEEKEGEAEEKKEGEEEVKNGESKEGEQAEVKEKIEVERIIIGNIKVVQCVKIAKMKMDSLLAKDLKAATKQIVGTCASMPITVEGKTPKEVIAEINEGKYDQVIQ